MVTPQLLLLLLLFRGLASAALAPSAASQQQECGGSPYNEPAEPGPQCPVVPCANTTQTLILALPVLLTLNHPNPQTQTQGRKENAFQLSHLPNPQEDQQTVTQPSPGWAMSLQLLDEMRRKVGSVVLMSEEGDVTLKGVTCDALNKGASIPLDALWGGHSLHLGVTAKEGKVRLTHVVGSKSITVLDLVFSGGLPSWVRVTSATDYGYSALTTTTTTDTTDTTTPSTIPPSLVTTTTSTKAVVVAVSTLVGVSVVVSVGVLVMACWGRLEAEALLRVVQTQAAPPILHLQ